MATGSSVARHAAGEDADRPAGAPGRPYWRGRIRLGLVTLPVKVHRATRSGARPALHRVHAPTGQRVRYETTVPGIGPVDRDEILMGFEYAKDSFVLLAPEELDRIRVESRRTIDLVQFVDADGIDPIYFAEPFHVVPDGAAAASGFVVLREALRRTRRIGLGQMAHRGGESIVALRACGKGLLLETLRFADEIRDPSPLHAGLAAAPPDPEALALAEQLILRRSGPFDARVFRDHYAAALRALIERKLHAPAVPPPALEDQRPAGERERAEMLDPMQALKARLERPMAAPSESGAPGKPRPPTPHRAA
jgi:DNA end-binding protein Ku